MKFKQHFSGSSGNLYTIRSGKARIIIECGVVWSKLRESLGSDLTGIEGCFVSHYHQDHSKSAKQAVINGIDLYASADTIEYVDEYVKPKSFKLTGHRRVRRVGIGTMIYLESFEVYCFETLHDCPGSLGFVVYEKSTGEYLLFATDTKCIIPEFKRKFSIVAIEASFDGDTLARKVKSGEVNKKLAERLLDSHQEIHEALRYITEFCDKSKLHEIHILHMSGRNSDKAKTKKLFEDKLMIDTIYCER